MPPKVLSNRRARLLTVYIAVATKSSDERQVQRRPVRSRSYLKAGIQAMVDIREHHRKQAARQQRGSVRHNKADLQKAPHHSFTGIVCAPSSIQEHALHAEEYH